MSSYIFWGKVFLILVLASVGFSWGQPDLSQASVQDWGQSRDIHPSADSSNGQFLPNDPAAAISWPPRSKETEPFEEALTFSKAMSGPAAQPSAVATVNYALRHDRSPSLRDIAANTSIGEGIKGDQQPREFPVLPLPTQNGIRAQGEFSQGDPVLQPYAPIGIQAPAPSVNFEGISNLDNSNVLGFPLSPPDTEGDVGPNHYVQMINVTFAIWDKGGNLLLGPLPNNALWSGFGGPCETSNDGDPIVLYDHLADRWMMSQFAVSGPFYQCIAISQTPDPTGAWYRYEFLWSDTIFNDYPKFGVWPDGYYMSVNQFIGLTPAGGGAAVFEREQMLQGQPARLVTFLNLDPDTMGMLPADLDGPPPPPGTPNYFVRFDDDNRGAPADRLQIYEFSVDWTDPANSTFTGPTSLLTAPFNSVICLFFRGQCIDQPGTTQLLEALADRLMFRLQFRNFGSYQTLVTNHSVNVGLGQAGIRWYELRDSGGGWNIFQQGTYAGDTPNSDHRWMGSAAMDGSGNIAVGYSVSSSGLFPSIRYVGRLGSDTPGTLPQGETTLITGGGSQPASNRWGDYSMMAVDPIDDCTFWYTQQYVASTTELFGLGWRTRIGAFRFPTPDCTDTAQGTLQGTVTDATTGLPLANGRVEVGGYIAFTDTNGAYQIPNLPAGTYDVTASAYGYISASVNGLAITADSAVVQDFALDPAPAVVVSGTVTDVNTGWPLYARIGIDAPGFSQVIFTDPETGSYNVQLTAGAPHLFEVTSLIAGYDPESRTVTPAPGGSTEDFALAADSLCNAPGYTLPAPIFFDDFESDLGNWNSTGLWNLENEGDACGVQIAPFPSSSSAAYYGLDSICTYDTGSTNTGDLTLTTPVAIPASGNQLFTFYSYEVTECDGDCPFDNRQVEISIDGGASWALLGEGDTESVWHQKKFDLSAYQDSNALFRFRFDTIDDFANTFFGWMIDDVAIGECQPPPSGGLVVGHVYDANTGGALNGATVDNDSGESTLTAGTPDDPAVDDGFYALFSPAGSHTFTAMELPGYGTDSQTPTVIANDTIRQDFNLAAGQLAASPTSIDVDVPIGTTKGLILTLSNNGGLGALFEIRELPGNLLISSSDASTWAAYNSSSFDTSTAGTPKPGRVSQRDRGQTPDWGKTRQIGARLMLESGVSAAGNLPIIIADPPGDASFIDVTNVEGLSIGSDLVMRLHFNPGSGPTGAVGYIHLDTDQDAATGLPPTALFGLSTQDIGYDYYLSLFNLPTTVDIFDAGDNFVGSVTPVLTANAVEFAIPLIALGNDDGNVDVTLVLGDFSGPTDWAPDVGHGTTLGVFDIPWLAENPISGTIAAPANQTIALNFDARRPLISQTGPYSAQLRILDDTPYNLSSIPVIMNVVPAVYGVTITPSIAAKEGPPGTTVSYTLQIANTGNVTDSFRLTATGNTWPVGVSLGLGASASTSIGPLEANSSDQFDILVSIPGNAAIGASDVVSVTLSSQGDPTKSALAILTTTANPAAGSEANKRFLPLILKE